MMPCASFGQLLLVDDGRAARPRIRRRRGARPGPLRQSRRAAAATPAAASVSPAGWPSVSLTALKRSRSSRNTEQRCLRRDRADQRIVERPAQDLAVGKAGQRILARQPVELDFRLAHLGQVGGEAAEAEEAADFVVDRPARDRPPDFVLGLGPDDEVLEGDVRRQIETERPFRRRPAVGGLGRNQVGERAVDQVGWARGPGRRPRCR